MSDEGMGSLIDSAPPVVEDVDDVPPHAIHVHEPDATSASTTATTDAPTTMSAELSLLDEKFSLLLAAHSREAASIGARMDALEALKLGSLMTEAASSAAEAAASAAASAEAAAKLVASAGEAVETAAAVMEAAREAVKQISADGAIPDLLAEHCKSAACSARDTVLQALDECREDAEEFAEEVQQRAEQKATGKRGGKKR